VFLSILESSRHELRIAHGLTLMTPSLRGWEAFPTPGALTYTRITWAFSSPAPQVPGVTPGSPLCPWCFGHPFGEVRDSVGHQRTESTNIGCNQWLSLAKIALKMSLADRNRSLVANTSMCREGNSIFVIMLQLGECSWTIGHVSTGSCHRTTWAVDSLIVHLT
jgi:hypothetical protein